MSIALGAYDLERLIGAGGMAQVWEGVHREQRTRVAVKVLEAGLDQGKIREAFLGEVRAAAGLDHPGIVRVLDYGEVPPGTPPLATDQPFLVMELLQPWRPGPGSASAPGGASWPALERWLHDVLDALAHAHARGIVHLDLKPANILNSPSEPAGGPPRYGRPKLTDFGLARVMDREAELRQQGKVSERLTRLAGTPAYMAPEQCQGRWRDYGPWTDLYALGCVVWECLTGQPPFAKDSPMATILAQVTEATPQLPRGAACPEGLEAWLGQLLRKDPRRRFQRAADAAGALLQLGSTLERPVAIGWRRQETPRAPGLGLSLFGLRTVPLTGRGAEQAALWSALEDTSAKGASAMVLRGAVGYGTSSLARWLCERAHELGAATVLQISHGPSAGGTDGLTSMLLRELRCAGLDREAVAERLGGLMGDAPERLIDCLTAPSQGESESGRSSPRISLSERFALIERFVRHRASSRAVILWMDDVQWGLDALSFANHLLHASPDTPVLLLLTVRDEELALRPAETELLVELAARARVRAIEVGPLRRAHQRALIDHLLPLEDRLAHEVAVRTAGSPLFAVQLIGDWVQRDVLERGPDGYRLIEGASAELPIDLQQVWRQRLERLLDHRDEGEGRALELAAVLGHEVYEDEWHAACLRAAAYVSPALIEALFRRRLCQPIGASRSGTHRAGWRFAHSMLREALELRAKDAGRLAAHHQVCAEMLAELDPAQAATGGFLERLGHHQLGAGLHQQAAMTLERASDLREQSGDTRLAEALWADRCRALEALGEADERRGRGLLGEALRFTAQARLPEAESAGARALEAAERHGWWQTGLEAAILLGQIALRSGDLARARDLLVDAEARLEVPPAGTAPRDADPWRIRLWRLLAVALAGLGAHQPADDLCRRAMALAEVRGEVAELARLGDRRGQIALQTGRLGDARGFLEQARGDFESCQQPQNVAVVENHLGELARREGRLDDAEGHHRRARDLFGAGDPGAALWSEVYLALLIEQRGDWGEAARRLQACAETAHPHQGHLIPAIHVLLLPGAAATADWAAWDQHVQSAAALREGVRFLDPRVAEGAERAATLALDAAEPARARAALALAAALWQGLSREAELAAARIRLAELGG